jgi:hypothetical protein
VGTREIAYLDRAVHTERAIEIPWVSTAVGRPLLPAERVLEVGNVLNGYRSFEHVVVDKYESDTRVTNIDVLDFRPDERFALIVSVSTLEHVGFDEPVTEPGKVLRAIRHLRVNCLSESGEMYATLPFGYNPEVDQLILEQTAELGEVHLMQRVSPFNLWRETTVSAVAKERASLAYGQQYSTAAVVAFVHVTA